MKHLLYFIALTMSLSITLPSSALAHPTTKPKSLVFAVQPKHALLIKNKNYDNNIVMKLAKKLNTQIAIYECPWARCVKAIELGDADIIDDLFFSTDRALYTHFLQPSFETQSSGYRFYADNTRTKVIEKWSDLIGLRIGYLRGYKHFPKFDESKEINKVDFINLEVIVKQLSKGYIDVFISPPSFDEKNFKAIDSQNKMSQQPYAHIEPTPLFVGLSKKSPWISHTKEMEEHLTEIINENIESN